MKTPIIATHWSYDSSITFGTRDYGVTMTVPDQTMSVSEILSRYSRGLAIPQTPVFEASTDLSDFDSLDAFQKLDLARAYAKRVEVLKMNLTESKAKIARERAKRDFDRAVDAKVASTVKPSSNG